MQISAHEQNNMYFLWGVPVANEGWALGWTSQKLVSATEVTNTGGTFD